MMLDNFEAYRKHMLLRLHCDRRLSATDLRVAVHLLMRTKTGRSFAPWDQLAGFADASVEDVQRSVERLRDLGYFAKATVIKNGEPVEPAAMIA
jgi:hypothetical protein